MTIVKITDSEAPALQAVGLTGLRYISFFEVQV